MQRFVDSVLAVAKEWAPFSSSSSSSFYIDLNKMIVSLFLSFMYCSSWVMSLWVLFIYLFLLLFVYMGFFGDLTNWVNPEMLIHFWVFIYLFFNVVVVINNQDYLTWLRNGLDYATSPPPLIIIIIIISFV